MPDSTDQPTTDSIEPGMNEVLARNIRTLLGKRRAEERKASIEQKVADAITRGVSRKRRTGVSYT